MTEKDNFTLDNPIMFDKKNRRCRCVPIPYEKDMTEKRFVNNGKDIFQYGEWWCSANGEHCADVIATAINELIEENEQLKLISNYRGEMVSFATSLIQDMGSEEMLKMWNDFTEFMYQKWKKKRGIK